MYARCRVEAAHMKEYFPWQEEAGREGSDLL